MYRGEVKNQAEKIEKCLPVCTGTKIYFPRVIANDHAVVVLDGRVLRVKLQISLEFYSSRPDNYYIINSSGVQKCNVIFYYFLRGRRM